MDLAKRLKAARENAKLSQNEVAEKLNISRQAISKWENGWTSPDIDNLVILSELYNISLDELLKKDCDVKNKNDDTKQEGNKLLSIRPEEIGIMIVVMCLSTIPCLGLVCIIFLLGYCAVKKYKIGTLCKAILLCFLLISMCNSFQFVKVEFLDVGEATIEKVASTIASFVIL